MNLILYILAWIFTFPVSMASRYYSVVCTTEDRVEVRGIFAYTTKVTECKLKLTKETK